MNIASVMFNGDVSGNILLLEKLVRCMLHLLRVDLDKKPVNYGFIVQLGDSYTSYIGGILKYLLSLGLNRNGFQDSPNYDTITHKSTTHLDDTSGYSYYARTENRVSSGKISVAGTKLKLIS